MLTGDLRRARVKAGTIAPILVDPDAAPVREAAEAVSALFSSAREASRARGDVAATVDDHCADHFLAFVRVAGRRPSSRITMPHPPNVSTSRSPGRSSTKGRFL